jgi:mRNA-degrading endonuclease RelE of RelBE toxin-antitoxin system
VGRFEIEFSKKAAKDYKKLPKDFRKGGVQRKFLRSLGRWKSLVCVSLS